MNQLNQHPLSPWLAIAHMQGLGLMTKWQLLKAFQWDPLTLLDSDSQTLRLKGFTRKLPALPWDDIERSLGWLVEQPNHHIITCCDDRYPNTLAQIAQAPLLLYVKGNPARLLDPQLAMVGSRNPTFHGIDTAKQFAKILGLAGLTITSGMALGIDGASHEGALQAKTPTLAVLGTGLKKLYPLRHKVLAQRILENGAIISEYPPHTPAQPTNFPRRNRIISGLSLGTLVVEATLKSGSLITSRFAMEQGREVFAIPGSIHNPLSKGCHHLIAQGAKLVQTSDDILQEIMPQYLERAQRPKKDGTIKAKNTLAHPHADLVEYVGFEATSVDTIAQRSGQNVADIAAAMVELEMAGIINQVPSGYLRSTLVE